MTEFVDGHPIFTGYPLEQDYLDWIDKDVEAGSPGGDYYFELHDNAEWWATADRSITKIVKWHQEEAHRLRELADRTGDDKARAKGRWHWEALRMYGTFGIDT